MSIGPGRYNDEASFVRELCQARAVILAVFDGNRGEGFEVQSGDPDLLARLPTILRAMADQIEADGPLSP